MHELSKHKKKLSLDQRDTKVNMHVIAELEENKKINFLIRLGL